MSDHIVCRAEEVTAGRGTVVQIEGREIGVFRIGKRLVAFLNRCPHQGAPVCRGTVEGTIGASQPGQYDWTSDDCVLRCPWHGWEFDLRTGQALFDANIKLKKLPVREVEDEVIITF